MKAQVICDKGPRSYKIQTKKGTRKRRNRQHLLKSSETFDSYHEVGSKAYDSGDEDIQNPATQDVSSPSTIQLANENQACQQRILPLIVPRQSTCAIRVPKRLTYDEKFNQVCE